MKQHYSGRSNEPGVGAGSSASPVVIPVRHQTRRRTFWTKDEEQALAAGVKKYGPSAWTAIFSDPELTFHPNRVPIDLKDKWRVIISARRRRQQAANQPPLASMTTAGSQRAALSQPQKRSREPTPTPNQRPTPLSIFQPISSPSQLSHGLPTPLLTPRRRPSDRHPPPQHHSPILLMSAWDQHPTVDPFLFAHATELMPEHLATGSMAWLPSSDIIPSTTIKDTLRRQMHEAVTAVSKRTSSTCNLNRPSPEPPPARPSPTPSETPTPLPFEHISVDFLNVRYHPKVNNRVTLHSPAPSSWRQRSRSASPSPSLPHAERKRAHSRPPSPTDSTNESATAAAVDDIDQLAELVNSVLHMGDRSRADTLAVLAHASSSPFLSGDGADGAERGSPQVMRSLDARMASPDGCTQPALCVDVYVDLPTLDMYEELMVASARFRAGAGRARQVGGERSCYVQ